MDPTDPTVRGLAATVRRLQQREARLRDEQQTQIVVDIATGILAERLGCPPTEAAAQLAKLAKEAGLPVPVLAADLAGYPDGPPPGPVALEPPTLRAGPMLAVSADLRAAARAVLDQGAAPIGATVVVIWRYAAGGALALAAHAGLTAAEADPWRHVPPGVDTPAQRVARTGEEQWPDGSVGTGPRSVGGVGDRAVLPLLQQGRRVGVLEFVWPGTAPLLPSVLRRQLRALATLCATLLDTAGPTPEPEQDAELLDALLSPALLLQPLPGPAGVPTDFRIVRTNRVFTDPLGRARQRLEGATLVETYPTACATGLLDRLLSAYRSGRPLLDEELDLTFQSGGPTRPVPVRLSVTPLGGRLLVSWDLTTERTRQAALLRQAQRLVRVCGFEEDRTTGTVLWNEGLRELYGLPPEAAPVPLTGLAGHAHPDDGPAVRRLLETVQQRRRFAAVVLRLLHPDGSQRYVRVVAEPVLDEDGRITAVRGAYHDVSSQHWAEVALGATRERLADTEQESTERGQLALRLQQAILPHHLPILDESGLRYAVRYRPAAERDRVGGDWYDVLRLPDGRVLLVVGDVAGHGVEAATGMIALRHALRGLAITGAPPGQLLAWANAVALRENGRLTATVVCAVIDPVGRELRWARAGHLPPVLISGGRISVLPLPSGVLLGALEDATYEEQTLQLASSDVLLLCTDGLVERRDRPVEQSLRQLTLAVGHPGTDLERYVNALLTNSRADTDDDTCLVALRVE